MTRKTENMEGCLLRNSSGKRFVDFLICPEIFFSDELRFSTESICSTTDNIFGIRITAILV